MAQSTLLLLCLVASWSLPIDARSPPSPRCYMGVSTDYSGNVNTTITNVPCQYWTWGWIADEYRNVLPEGVAPNHNFCRDWDDSGIPWCINIKQDSQYCFEQQCPVSDISFTATPHEVNPFNRQPLSLYCFVKPVGKVTELTISRLGEKEYNTPTKRLATISEDSPVATIIEDYSEGSEYHPDKLHDSMTVDGGWNSKGDGNIVLNLTIEFGSKKGDYRCEVKNEDGSVNDSKVRVGGFEDQSEYLLDKMEKENNQIRLTVRSMRRSMNKRFRYVMNKLKDIYNKLHPHLRKKEQ